MRYHFKSQKEMVDSLNDYENIFIYKGWVPEQFYRVKDLNFKFVHLDVDLYEPTLESLKFFYPRVGTGGIIVCDDYNSKEFPGAKLAWDHYLEDKEDYNFLSFPFGGCVLVKS